jgi:hypothetical protein
MKRKFKFCSLIVVLVDIGGIVDHHCLNFIFIIQYKMWQNDYYVYLISCETIMVVNFVLYPRLIQM